MYISEILERKGRGEQLTKKEYDDIVVHLCKKTISAVQLGAFLMAIFSRGMTLDEAANFTSCFVSHSDKFRWADQQWYRSVVDKQSTGGVGDKTSHVLAPIIVCCGGKVPMISGRGLGTAGGTIDKFESITGYTPFLPETVLRKMLDDPGFFIIGMTDNFIPAERALNKYRHVTGTMLSIPLLTSSILARKLIEDVHGLVIDIKLGTDSLVMKKEELEVLAKYAVNVGLKLGMEVICVLSYMDEPLGECVGNALEMAEVFAILAGRPLNGRLGKLIKTLGSQMLSTIAPKPDPETIVTKIEDVLNDRQAQKAMRSMLIYQGVDEKLASMLCSDPPVECEDVIDYYIDIMKEKTLSKTEMKSSRTGYITQVDACTIALVVWRLGGNRDIPDHPIDHSVGIRVFKHVGDQINKGEPWCSIHHNEKEICPKIHTMMHAAITILDEPTNFPDVIYKIID